LTQMIMVVESSLANLRHFEGKWKHGATRTIRVPIALADEILALARRLDSGDKSLDTAELDKLKAELEAIKSERGYLADLKRIQRQTELEERNRELQLKRGEERKAKVEAQTELERLRRDYAIAKSQLQAVRDELEEVKSLVTSEAIVTTTPIMPTSTISPDTIDYSILGIRELKLRAKAAKIKNYGVLTKAELIKKLTKK